VGDKSLIKSSSSQSSKEGSKKILFNLISLSCLAIVSACGAPPPPPQPGAMPVKIGKVQLGKISDSSDYVATLNSRQSITLQPRIAGQVSQILVKQGDQVNAGTPILQIDPAEQEAALQSRNAALETVKADIDANLATLSAKKAAVASAKATSSAKQATRLSKSSDLALQRRDLKRDQELQADGAITQRELERRLNSLESAVASLKSLDQEIKAQNDLVNQTEAELQKAQADVVSAQKRLQEAKANTRQQKVQLQFYRISAPFTGTVGDIPVKVGDFVNTATKLFTLTQSDRLEVEIAVPLDKLEQLKLGLAVQLLDAQSQPQTEAKVSFIAPNVNAQSQSILVKAAIANDKNSLRADQLVRARLIWEERAGVLIPTSAISRLGGQNFVFVVEKAAAKDNAKDIKSDSKASEKPTESNQPPTLVAKQKPIKIGKIVANNQEILSGLKPDDQIVVSGIQLLQDGMPVMQMPTNPVSQK
jgi:multidrug efflux pump subunit AcrA (membrane-fusion protein)